MGGDSGLGGGVLVSDDGAGGVCRAQLRVPARVPAHVRRVALEHRLLGDATALIAPAGFGTTQLVAGAVADGDRPVAWLTLRATQNGPNAFWAAVAAALRASGLRSVDPDAGAVAVLDAVERDAGDRHLVIDDVQVLDDLTAGEVEMLLRFRPPQLAVTLLGARLPLVGSLAAERASDTIAVATADDLRFGDDAAAHLLAEMGIAVSRGEVVAANAATHGWGLGLRLVGMAARVAPADATWDDVVREATTELHRSITSSTLAALPADLRTVLERAAVLDRFEPELLAAVADRADDRLAVASNELHRRSLLLPLPGSAGLWTVEPAVRRTVLGPDDLADRRWLGARRRAVRWLAANGRPADAIDHLIALRVSREASGLIEARVPELLAAGQWAQLVRWVRALDADVLRAAAPALATFALLWAAADHDVDLHEHLAPIGEFLDDPVRRFAHTALVAESVGDVATLHHNALARPTGDTPLESALVEIVASRSLVWSMRAAGADGAAAEAHAWALASRTPVLAALSLAHAALASALRADHTATRGHLGRLQTLTLAGVTLPRTGRIAAAIASALDTSHPDRVAPARRTLADVEQLIDRGREPLFDALLPLLLVTISGPSSRPRMTLVDEQRVAQSLGRTVDPGPLLLQLAIRNGADVAGPPDPGPEGLTAKERLVLQMLRSDLTLRELAALLSLTQNTVKSHCRMIYRKLGVDGREAAVLTALAATRGDVTPLSA